MQTAGLRVAGAGLALALVVAPAAAQQAVTLPARDKALGERMTNVWTVGTDEGRDWEMFAGIRSVAFDRRDNLYVLDQQNNRVVVFDATGRYLRQFGRKGQGPGEFGAPMQLAVTTDDQVVVSDLGNRAFIVFRTDGEYVRNVPYADGMMIGLGGIGMYAHPQGGIVSRSSSMIRPDNPQQDNVTTIFRLPLQERAPTTALLSLTLPKPQIQQGPGGREGGQSFRIVSMDPVFGARPTFGVLPDGGVAVHYESNYNIRVLDGSGRAVRTITRPIQPKRVTERDKEAWDERRREAEASGTSGSMIISMTQGAGGSSTRVAAPGGGAGRAPQAIRMNIDDMPFAEYMAVVTGVRTDPQGRIWVQRRHQDGRDQGPIDLVMGDGRYLGTLPAQALPDAMSASGLAAFIVRDDMGVEGIAVRRIPAGWR